MTPPALVSLILATRSGVVRVRGALSRIGIAPLILTLATAMPLPVDGGRSLLGLPSLCVFYATTGLPCPGCGITRSVVCCCHLRLGEALTYHPAGPLVFLWLTGAVLLRFPLPAAWRRWLHALPLSLRSGAGIALVALLFGIWGARLGGWLPSPP